MAKERPSAGAMGGAANELGASQRAGVGAYVAAHILRGQTIPELGMANPMAIPQWLKTEADSAVDDIEVGCDDGTRVWMQVKTRLDSQSMASCVEQWGRLSAELPLDPAKHRVLAVAGEATASVRTLQSALRRAQRKVAGRPTTAEQRMVDSVAAELSRQGVPSAVLSCAGIWIVDLRSDNSLAQRLGAQTLDGHVVAAGLGLDAWVHLRDGVRLLAAQRHGANLDDFIALLQAGSCELVADRAGRASARRVAAQQVVATYRAAVANRGQELDLTTLGAGLAPIPLADLDMTVDGALPGESTVRGGHPLPWLVRRFGRVLLVGPPGSGKTVAARAIAAFYARREDWPLPVVVSLPRLLERRCSVGDLDALIEAGLEQELASDRPVLSAEIRRALADGSALLVLDALDETRDQRRDVVAGIREITRRVHADVEIALSTREVAYADAATLAFTEIELVPPKTPAVTIDTILRAAADRGRVPARERNTWFSTRRAWVYDRLAESADLWSTPLSVVLLTLLAARGTPGQLPNSRAGVLQSVMLDVVARWSAAQRHAGHPVRLGRLQDGEATRACWEAFRHVGHYVVHVPRSDAAGACAAVASVFVERYGLAAGSADVAAEAAVAFWDEHGVFAAEGPDQILVARVQSLAELADALFAVDMADDRDRDAWVRWALKRDVGREQLKMAAILSPAIADVLTLEAARHADMGTAENLIAACRAGASASIGTMKAVVERLLERLVKRPSWRIALTLALLPVPEEHRDAVLQALARFDGFQQTFVRAATAVAWPRIGPTADADLLAFLKADRQALASLDVSRVFRRSLMAHHADVYLGAVARVVGPRDIQLVRQLLRNATDAGSSWHVRGLRSLLVSLGFMDIVAQHDRERHTHVHVDVRNDVSMQRLLEVDAEFNDRIDAAITQACGAPSVDGAVRRLDKLASLITTLHRIGPSTTLLDLRNAEDVLPILCAAVIRLSGLPTDALAREAAELRRIVTAEGRDARLAMIHAAPPLQPLQWSRVPDREHVAAELAALHIGAQEWTARFAETLLDLLLGERAPP